MNEVLVDLDEYARGARDRLGPDTWCSITLRHQGDLRHVASSDDRSRRCDQVEVRTGEGPCVDAMRLLSGVLVPSLDTEERWPDWRRTAVEVGFRSSAALPAVVDDRTAVALNLYSDEPDPWDRERLLAIDAYVQEVAEAIRTRLGS